MKKNWILLIPVLILVVVGTLLIKFSPYPYDSMNLPRFAPPGFVFGIAWTIFYAIFYYSATKTISIPLKKKKLFQLYVLVLSFQLVWILFFFTLGYQLLALFILIVIYLLSVAFVFEMAKISKKQALWNLPYLLWLLFATLLNLSVLVLN